MRATTTKKTKSLFIVLAVCAAFTLLCLPAAAADGPSGGYAVEKVAEGQPQDLMSITRLTYGNVDRLVFGEWSSLYMYQEGWAGVLHLANLSGPYHNYYGILSVFTNNNIIYATPYSGGQGCKLEMLYIDENGNITQTAQESFEWTLADHDLTDKGRGAKDPRNGRLIMGYGNPHRESEAPEWEEGQPLKGVVMEYGQPSPNQWDCWSNQLEVRADSPRDSVGLFPHSFVSLENNQILVAAHGHGRTISFEKTYFPLLEGRPWDGATPDGPGSRAPQRQGYWSFVKNASGDILSVAGVRDIWDPFSEGGDFNDYVFLFGGDVTPSYFLRSDLSTRKAMKIFHPDSEGNYQEVTVTEGETQLAAVHPVTNKPIVVASKGGKGTGIYEAVKNADGVVCLYRVALLSDSGGNTVLVHAYKNSVYIITGGNIYRVNG